MKKSLLTVLLSSSVLLLSACGGGDGDTSYVISKPGDDIPLNNIANPVVTVEDYTKDSMTDAAAISKLMTYKMLGVDGKEVNATALVFTPKIAAPVGGWPIVVWAHGTTGVADKCAPSAQGLQGTEALLKLLLAQGYVVVAPDYEGLGSAGNHPFLNLKSEAFSITDAVVATRNYLKAQNLAASDKWVSIGHSQGGHAVLGAAQYAARAQLDYKGTVAIAPASNLALILSVGETQAAQKPLPEQIGMLAQLDTYTSLIVAGMQGYKTTVSYSQVFQPDTAEIAPVAETECGGTVGQALGNGMLDYAQGSIGMGSLKGYGRTQSKFMEIPVIQEFLEKGSQPGLVKLNQKVIIYQGEADTTVPSAATDILNGAMKNKGSSVTYISNKTWDHKTVYTQNFSSFVQDIGGLLNQ
ncbi:alpha/beta fold hydrolase [Acinetobacter chinensis]|uniref:Alpha/beta fold hydrolase n=1 Tax=Acinetobacter chinensis TaxID=2004650 RepID=A0A3B7LZ75_9GAMM|nr:alpha/beta fold hydrolase [Acinetobacter chinensis]AXY57244.1 alpha/beta fold hydrolase [Acinetobacter chinensis]